jgi:hypothetical protein
VVDGEVCDWECLGVFGSVWMVEGQVFDLNCTGVFGWLREKCVTGNVWECLDG